LCTLSFFSANVEEPAFSHKKLFLDRIHAECPHLPTLKLHKEMSGAIVKPAHGTSVKVGVKLGEWSIPMCERLGSPCIEQPYHPGPWEIRLYKSRHWYSPVSWIVPRGENIKIDFPWVNELQKCIDRALPLTQFLSVDVRSNGTDLLVLEVNGVAGMPFEWTLGETSLPFDMWTWFYQRYSEGINTLQWDKTLKLLCLVFQRTHLRRVNSRQRIDF
jgi:hypothetical protein